MERKYAFKSGVNIMFGCNNLRTTALCLRPRQGAQPPPGGDHRGDQEAGAGRRDGGHAAGAECQFTAEAFPGRSPSPSCCGRWRRCRNLKDPFYDQSSKDLSEELIETMAASDRSAGICTFSAVGKQPDFKAHESEI